MGDKAGVAKSYHQLGNVAYLQGDYAAARRYYQQSLEIKQALGDKAGVAISLGQLGKLAEAEGKLEEAVRLWAAAAAIFQELRSPYLKLALSDLARAREKLGEERFEELMREVGLEVGR